MTAVETVANELLPLLCPVSSLKAVGYTATVGFLFGLKLAKSLITRLFICADDLVGSFCHLPLIAQLESKITNRQSDDSRATSLIGNCKCNKVAI